MYKLNVSRSVLLDVIPVSCPAQGWLKEAAGMDGRQTDLSPFHVLGQLSSGCSVGKAPVLLT